MAHELEIAQAAGEAVADVEIVHGLTAIQLEMADAGQTLVVLDRFDEAVAQRQLRALQAAPGFLQRARMAPPHVPVEGVQLRDVSFF